MELNLHVLLSPGFSVHETLNGGGEGTCGTCNYRNPVRKFAKFPFTEPIKWKTLSPARLLIECNSGRKSNSINCMFLKAKQLE